MRAIAGVGTVGEPRRSFGWRRHIGRAWEQTVRPCLHVEPRPPPVARAQLRSGETHCSGIAAGRQLRDSGDGAAGDSPKSRSDGNSAGTVLCASKQVGCDELDYRLNALLAVRSRTESSKDPTPADGSRVGSAVRPCLALETANLPVWSCDALRFSTNLCEADTSPTRV